MGLLTSVTCFVTGMDLYDQAMHLYGLLLKGFESGLRDDATNDTNTITTTTTTTTAAADVDGNQEKKQEQEEEEEEQKQVQEQSHDMDDATAKKEESEKQTAMTPSCPLLQPGTEGYIDNRPKLILPDKIKLHKPDKKLKGKFIHGINQYDMIKDGDRIMVCVSGGKDSLTMLHLLKYYQSSIFNMKGIKVDIAAATVDPGTDAYDPSPLIDYMKQLDIPYFFIKQNIINQARKMKDLKSICSFCARMKRGALYATARREGYNVLAFGQHMDDCVESFMMSVFHNGYVILKNSYFSKSCFFFFPIFNHIYICVCKFIHLFVCLLMCLVLRCNIWSHVDFF